MFPQVAKPFLKDPIVRFRDPTKQSRCTQSFPMQFQTWNTGLQHTQDQCLQQSLNKQTICFWFSTQSTYPGPRRGHEPGSEISMYLDVCFGIGCSIHTSRTTMKKGQHGNARISTKKDLNTKKTINAQGYKILVQKVALKPWPYTSQWSQNDSHSTLSGSPGLLR